MKLALASLSAGILLSIRANAWNVDPRCPDPPPQRRLDLNWPSPTPEDIVAFDVDDGRHVVSDDSSKGLLRGANHRELEDVTYFHLKMYWQEGYCWQEEWEEREWCLECQSSGCDPDEHLWVKTCDANDKAQKFVYEAVSGTGGGKLKPYTRQDLCWERTSANMRQLRPCSSYNTQIIKGIDFNDKFEMVPDGESRKNDCLTQPHHPKNEEIVRGEFCKPVRYYNTSYWIMYYKSTGNSSSGGSSGAADSRGSDIINNRGQEYCDGKKCGLCEGDCDSDDQCEGNLKCFQRNGNQPVPGCKGGDSASDSGRDFCYDPTVRSGGDGGGSDTIKNLGKEYCDGRKCGLCEGDCDSDDQCEGNLKCFFRSKNEPVPGCKGGDGASDSGRDFCYDPNASSGGRGYTKAFSDKGSDYCNKTPCDLCEGDCDDDSQCKGNLICFQRSVGDAIPGCSGLAHSNSDFCIEPGLWG